MRVYGIDVNALTRKKRTGTERYVFELIQEMKRIPLNKDERVVLYASADIPDIQPLPPGWSVQILSWPTWLKGWTHLRLGLHLWRNPPNVFFTPAHEVPLCTGGALVVSTIHDIAFRHVPEVYTWKGRLRQNWALRRAMKKSDAILTVSEATKIDLLADHSFKKKQIVVTHLGVDQGMHVDQVEKKQVLSFVGRLEEKKGVDVLIDAFHVLCEEGFEYELSLLGGFGKKSDRIKKKIDQSPWSDRVHVHGYVSDEERIRVVQESTLFIFPSRYEGFGLPILEAMQLHVPVLSSDLPVLQEVGGDAAVFFSVNDVNDCARQMTRILRDAKLRNDLVQKGIARVKAFTWESTAQKTWDVLQEL